MDEAIALSRISSDGQSMGHSLDAQEQSVQKVAKELGVKLVKTWSEIQTSKKGKNFGRTDLEQMLVYCKQNKRVKYVLVDMVNRLMREMKVMVYYLVMFEQLGVKVYFCDPSQQHLNKDDQITQLLVIIEGFSAEQDNASRRNTTIARMKARYQAGYYISHPHPGYIKSDIAGLHIPDPKRFELLKEAGKLIIYKQHTVKQAVQWLNSKGYRTKGGKKMDADHYVHIFSDRYYCGVIDIMSEGWPKDVVGLHQPMFTLDEHKRLVVALQNRNPQVRRKHNPDFAMANMLRHLECMNTDRYEKFSGIWHNRGKRNGKQRPLTPVYDCRGCRKRIRRDKANQAFAEYLQNLEFIPDEKRFRDALVRVWKNQRGSLAQRQSMLKTQKLELEQKVKNTAVALASEPNETAKQAFRILLDEYDGQLKELDTEIIKTENVEMESEGFVRFAMKFVEQLKLTWWSIPFKTRQGGEQILFNGKIYMDNSTKVHTPSLSSIYRLGTNKKALSNLDNAHLVELAVTATASNGLRR